MKRSKQEAIRKFFPTESARRRASKALKDDVASLLLQYPPSLVSRVREMKRQGWSLRKIYEVLGKDQRVLEVAMHLAVEGQAEEIGDC